MTETIALYIMAALVIVGGCMTAFVRHVLYCIIGLGISLLGVAGMFLYLGSPFVAAMQVLIYVGGITVAMVFAMMLSVAFSKRLALKPRKLILALITGLIFFVPLAWLITGTSFELVEPAGPEAWAPSEIGHSFLTTYNLVFEALSLVLLLAIIGAVLVARQEENKA
jgi:NADH-quinone oxidoreductase subunit J